MHVDVFLHAAYRLECWQFSLMYTYIIYIYIYTYI